jgi:hypothetical protein
MEKEHPSYQYSFRGLSETSLALAGAWLGLALPDVDLALLFVLHHRSLITHSIIVCILLKRWLPNAAYAGLLGGVSIHLWADSLSTTFGFAQVYLPILKIGIGPGLSFVWLFANSVAAAILAIRLYKSVLWAAIALYLTIALLYAILNEGGIFIAYVLALIGFVAFMKFKLSGGAVFTKQTNKKLCDDCWREK